MSCPAFCPTRVSDQPLYKSGRLPLIDQYEGFCMASGEAHVPDRETLFRCCNHGYSQNTCARFPAAETRSCLRYTVLRSTPDALEIMCVEECNHEPKHWRRLEYHLDSTQLRGDVSTDCMRAQAIAFCEAYLRRTRSEAN